MAIKGKRTIFTDAYSPAAQEGNALQADILPGMLVKHAATGFNKSAEAATVFGSQFIIADYDMLQAGTVDDAWTISENMIARQVPRDCRANVLVAAGQNILAVGTPLSSNGDGTLKIAATDGTEEIKCVADEIINVTTSELVRVRGA